MSKTYQDLAKTALQNTAEGPNRLYRSWVEARRLALSTAPEPLRSQLASGAFALSPGDDPFEVTPSPVTLGLASAVCALPFGLAAALLFKPSWASLAGATVGAFLGPWVAQGSRRLSLLANLLLVAALYHLLPLLPLVRLPLSVVLGLGVWLPLFKSKGARRFDMDRAELALVHCLKAEEAMALAACKRTQQSGDEDLWPQVLQLAQAQGDARLLAADALVEELSRRGLVEEGAQTFRWNEGSSELYELFGFARMGDLMVQERAPLMLGDKVQKGLARRAEG